MKLYLYLLVTFFLILSDNLFCQIISLEPNKITHIQSYGFEDESTIDLICNLMEDTSVVLIVDNYGNFMLNSLLLGYYVFEDGEEVFCLENIERLKKCLDTKRIIGFNTRNRQKIPTFYLKKRNESVYSKLINQHVPKTSNPEIFFSDSTSLYNFCQDIVNSYSFSKLDSLILVKTAFNQEITVDDFVNVNLVNKKFIYFHFDYTNYKEFDNSILLNKDDNSNYFVLLAKEGSKKGRSDYLKLKNKIKNANQLKKFDLIDKASLPKKIRITKKKYFRKEEVHNLKFIFIERHRNCLY